MIPSFYKREVMPLRFSIGYYRDNEWGDSIIDVLKDYPSIEEIYFPLPDECSGRKSLDFNCGSQAATSQLHNDLRKFVGQGKRLNLLLNAGCYAEKMTDIAYIERLKKRIASYVEDFGVSSVTTTQPSFATILKNIYGDRLEIRASVNMQVASIDAMRLLSQEFDAFYPTRELYRSIDELALWRRWADDNGKRLYALVNSGCLAACPWFVIDNNTVAHGNTDFLMADGTPIPTCYRWFSEHKTDLSTILKSCFIRPEDLSNYIDIFDGFKIATRTHFLPRLPIRAYLAGRYDGYITDLLEPSHTYIIAPEGSIPNRDFPEDWFKHTSCCHRQCHICTYCESVAKSISKPYSRGLEFQHFLFDNEDTLKERLAVARDKYYCSHESAL